MKSDSEANIWELPGDLTSSSSSSSAEGRVSNPGVGATAAFFQSENSLRFGDGYPPSLPFPDDSPDSSITLLVHLLSLLLLFVDMVESSVSEDDETITSLLLLSAVSFASLVRLI
jgi:hypothetical protein